MVCKFDLTHGDSFCLTNCLVNLNKKLISLVSNLLLQFKNHETSGLNNCQDDAGGLLTSLVAWAVRA